MNTSTAMVALLTLLIKIAVIIYTVVRVLRVVRSRQPAQGWKVLKLVLIMMGVIVAITLLELGLSRLVHP
jgi:cytochrome c oxidase assembly factor CtaG